MYTDQLRVEAYLKRELTDDEMTLIDDVISSISETIDSYTNRHWLSVDQELDDYTDVSFERTLDGNGHKELFIDDFSELESVDLLDSQGNSYLKLTSDTDWVLNSNNKAIKQSIKLRNYHFPMGTANVLIKAVWGSGSVPAGVVMVCTALVGKYFLKSSITGTFKSESIEGYSYTLLTASDIDNDTQKLMTGLDIYKRILL